jgi:serine protease
MPFLTAYPTGQTRPNASVLNAFEGQVVSNSVIIAAGTGGAIDVFAYRRTNVVVELIGYFGR